MKTPPFVSAILLLQFIPLLIFPPSLLMAAPVMIGVVAIFFVSMGILALRGSAWALTMSLYCQGMNVIVRLMMLLPNAMSGEGVLDTAFVTAMLLGVTISTWLLFRLDRPDVRKALLA